MKGVSHSSDSAPKRRRRFRRRRIVVFGALAVVMAAAVYIGLSAVAPLPAAAEAASGSSTITPAAVEPAFPSWGGSTAVGLVGQNGLLVQNGSTRSAPIASMTKTITALVLLDKHPIASGSEGPTITF